MFITGTCRISVPKIVDVRLFQGAKIRKKVAPEPFFNMGYFLIEESSPRLNKDFSLPFLYVE